MSELIVKKVEQGVLTLTFNRPAKKNAFNRDSWLALDEAFCTAQLDPKIACVVLQGAGDNFSSGMDLTDFAGGEDGAEHPFYAAQQTICAFDKPLIGAARGIAVGGGATLLLHCDIVYVGKSLKMRFPFVSLGLVPEFASSYMLQASIGSRRAAELMYTAEWIDAVRAMEVGIATACFEDDELLEQAQHKALEIAQWPVRSLQETKRCMKAAHLDHIEQALKFEKNGMATMTGSPENIEAVMAFMEKRKPDFSKLQ